VPGVTFDLDGNRIGRGFGYYDNFLRKVSPSAKIIALAFEMQIIKKIPADKNDIPVHKIITEKRIINTKYDIREKEGCKEYGVTKRK